jgi:putative membrane protein
MLRLLLHWVLNAVALLIVSHFVVGFQVGSVVSALIAVIVIGLFNATLGLLLKIITLPLGILTFGIFFLVINAVILWFSSRFVPGFAVTSFKAAFLGALALAVLHLLFGFLGRSIKNSQVAYRYTPIKPGLIVANSAKLAVPSMGPLRVTAIAPLAQA